MNRHKRIHTVLLLLLLFSPLLAQQKPGKIGGRVLDQRSLTPLVGANIVLQGTGLGAATDEDGLFLITDVLPGSYNLEIYYIGYHTVKRSNLIVSPNRTSTLEVHMEENYLEGETIEITGSFFDKPRDAVVSTRSMNYEEIRRSPGDLVDIQRAVQALPAVISGNDKLNEIIVRGGYPGENLFLMDNIEIPNPNHFPVQGSGGGPINLLNSYMVRNIDFYAGAFSSRYGDKASSVMDISLRNGATERFMAEANMGMAGLGLLLEGPAGSRGSYIVSARRSYLDWIIKSTGLTAVPQYYNFQGKMTLNLNSKNTLLINGLYGSDNINIEGDEEAGFSRGAENVDTRNYQFIYGATLKTIWNRQLYSFTTVSGVQSDYFAEVYENPGREVFFVNDSRENEYTAKTDFVWSPAHRLNLDFGASFKVSRFNYDVKNDPDTLFIYDPNGSKPDSAIGIFRTYPEYRIDRKVTSSKTATYAQFSWDFLLRWRITGGFRYDYFEYTDFNTWSPRLGLSYQVFSGLSLNLAYGKHYQSPSYIELAGNETNRKLRSKYNHQYVGGIDYLIRDDFKIMLELYYKDYRDVPINKILTTDDPFDFDDGTYLNEGSGDSRGFEIFLQKKMVHRFSSIVSYAYSQSRSLDPRFKSYYPSDYDYRQVLNFLTGYKYPFRDQDWYRQIRSKIWFQIFSWLPFLPADEMELSVKFRYMGGRPYTPPVYYPELREWIVEAGQPLNTSRYPVYHRLDVRIDRRFIFQKLNLVIFFDLVNIYNRNNVWSYQYNDDGTVDEILHYNTLPVGGISLEF